MGESIAAKTGSITRITHKPTGLSVPSKMGARAAAFCRLWKSLVWQW